MSVAFITGATSFSGRHLTRHLTSLGWRVVAAHSGRRPLGGLAVEPGLQLVDLDLLQADHVAAALAVAWPRYIFHLAGRTGPVGPPDELAAAFRDHALATATLLDAVRRLDLPARILIPGSSAQFGAVVPAAQPIAEEAPYRPLSLYGVAKTAEALTVDHYRAVHGLAVVRTHTFNCIGPGQREAFVPAAFARQIAMMERGLAEPALRVGNLAARRDLTDMRDVVKAYVAAVALEHPDVVYNVCSGRAPAIADLVGMLRSLARVPFEIRQDPARLQSADVPVQIGDPARLSQATGWRPTISIERSLADLLDEWRARV